MMEIQATNVKFAYGTNQVLDNINFKISDPLIYGLLGRNGAGKTTLLSLLGSFREPTSGQILINGEAPFENSTLMQHITFMYDKDFAGESNRPAQLLKYIHRYRPNFDLEYGMDLLKKFKLDVSTSMQKLSKGKKSAFNVIVGLASRSPITIFDEVYLGMDSPARDLFYKELLKEQQLHPRIIILSTHLVSEMDYLFDEVIIISNGSILLQEANEELMERYVTVIGHKNTLDGFVENKKVIFEENLGETRSVTLSGGLNDEERRRAAEVGLTIEPITLNDLFIRLTKEDE